MDKAIMNSSNKASLSVTQPAVNHAGVDSKPVAPFSNQIKYRAELKNSKGRLIKIDVFGHSTLHAETRLKIIFPHFEVLSIQQRTD